MAPETPRAPVLFFSYLVGAPIRDPRGERVAAVHDLIARLDLEAREQYPPLTGLVARIGGRDVFVPWNLVAEIDQGTVRLSGTGVDLARFERRPGEVLLGRDVLDRQLVDVDGQRIVRASDLVLTRVGSQVRVVGIDVGFDAIWRRTAPRALRRRDPRPSVIDWEDIEYLAAEAPDVRLKGGHPKIARLHPVEIARLVDQLPHRLGSEIVESLADEVAADVVEELSDEHQAQIVEGMDQERAADILEEMEPDAAADVLADLPDATAAGLLAEMAPEEAADVQKLLAHPEGTAGSLMTTGFAAVPLGLSAGAVLDRLRGMAERPAFLHDVYVVAAEDEARLVAVVALPDLVLAPPGMPVADLVRGTPPSCAPDTPVRDVAQQVADYNLLALPVVDGDGHLVGIVTVDDVMDELVPDAPAGRLPRLVR